MCGTNRPASGARSGTIVWRTFQVAPLIDNLPASNVSCVSATLVGNLVSTGSLPPTSVAVYWDIADRGPSSGLWAHTNIFSGPFSDGQVLSCHLTGLTDGQTYAYRYHAANLSGEYWASPAEIFSTLYGVPAVSNQSASNITFSSADFCGYLATTGTAQTAVEVMWGQFDAGTNRSGWSHTNSFEGFLSPGLLVTNISLPSSNSFYFYTYHATNARGESWAVPSASFMCGEVWLDTTAANAFEAGQLAATVTVCRSETATNFPIHVSLSISGTATPGTDYVLSPPASNVVLDAGVWRMPVSIIPIWDSSNEPAETVNVSLLPGAYIMGTATSASATIVNDPIVPGFNMSVTAGTWDSPSVWSMGRRPVAGDVVVATNAILLTNATERLAAFTNWGVLTFSNWHACLAADSVTLAGGRLEHVSCLGTNQTPLASNRVHIVCDTLVIESNASINVDECGYYPFGPGTVNVSYWSRYGGSYGGAGGKSGAAPYGSAEWPFDAGSCGGWQSGPGSGGRAGGAVCIEASGRVTIHGLISADGKKGGFDSGGGSGGGICITCDTIAGSGIVRANGGPPDNSSGGGGGGGRIAIHYNPANQTLLAPRPNLTLSCAGGAPTMATYGDLGTIHLSDHQLLPENMASNWNGTICNVTLWTPGHLVCSGLVRFASSSTEISATNDISFVIPAGYIQRPILAASRLGAGGSVILNGLSLMLTNGPRLECSGDLLMTNEATMSIYAAPTNPSVATGALVAVGGTFHIASNCWVYPFCDPAAGSPPYFTVQNLTVSAGGGFNANGAGFPARYNMPGLGPGAGLLNGTGGGYGGNGGRVGAGGGGYSYGDSNAPIEAGSSGHSQNNSASGRGGGAVLITASGTIRLEGSMLANGGNAPPYCGAASGGSVYLACRKFMGAPSGLLQANGGTVSLSNYWGCGGGGGRIAVWRSRDVNGQGVVAAEARGGAGSNGTGPDYNGGDGTVVWGWLMEKGTLFTVR